eukprot:TRINITY_DN44939_c0_g1_i1.p1 TRINITY_DN44939_c0_g1~~TRINITY_DN44939_c0_g1_i1.p1  ORF type:complete len:461 (-),score=111.39 TRINITY_DN44939_c0_g1_i1:100-1482(-)
MCIRDRQQRALAVHQTREEAQAECDRYRREAELLRDQSLTMQREMIAGSEGNEAALKERHELVCKQAEYEEKVRCLTLERDHLVARLEQAEAEFRTELGAATAAAFQAHLDREYVDGVARDLQMKQEVCKQQLAAGGAVQNSEGLLVQEAVARAVQREKERGLEMIRPKEARVRSLEAEVTELKGKLDDLRSSPHQEQPAAKQLLETPVSPKPSDKPSSYSNSKSTRLEDRIKRGMSSRSDAQDKLMRTQQQLQEAESQLFQERQQHALIVERLEAEIWTLRAHIGLAQSAPIPVLDHPDPKHGDLGVVVQSSDSQQVARGSQILAGTRPPPRSKSASRARRQESVLPLNLSAPGCGTIQGLDLAARATKFPTASLLQAQGASALSKKASERRRHETSRHGAASSLQCMGAAVLRAREREARSAANPRHFHVGGSCSPAEEANPDPDPCLLYTSPSPRDS